MPTKRDTSEHAEPTSSTAADAPKPDAAPDQAQTIAAPSQPHDEATRREREGLPPDAMILAPSFGAPPMRCPDDVWAMLVQTVDIIGDTDTDADHAGEVALFAGSWVPQQPPANGSYDGDLVVRLTHPADPTDPLPSDQVADIEMLLAYHGRWQRVGLWCGVDARWPRIVAPTAAAVMGLHGDVTRGTGTD